MTGPMKNLALVTALFSALTISGCNAGGDPGDPNVGVNTGPQESSVGKLPVPSNKSTSTPVPAGDSFGRGG